MNPDELLRRYPRETLRWLRGQLVLSQEALSERVGVMPQTVGEWERRRYAISPPNRAHLATLLAPQLATPEGAAFLRSLGRGADGEG